MSNAPTTSTRSSRPHSGIMVGFTALLLVYLLCPFVFLLPFFVAVKIGVMSEDRLEQVLIIVRPLDWLRNHVPAYRSFIDAEGEMLRPMLQWAP